MTNDSSNVAAVLRSFVVYGVCALLAIIVGVMMTNPLTYGSLGFMAFLCAFLFLPILLRWHHPLMIFAWNTPIVLFFIKGSPQLALAMIVLSLAVSVTERALGQRKFISAPQIAWPLIFLIGVVAITAKLTGGLGLKAFGSDVYGGKKYVFLIIGILGFFALAARPIPKKRARTYVTLYFGLAFIGCIGDLYQITPSVLHPIFWFIPPTVIDPNGFDIGTTRLTSTGWAATGLINALIACYGLRGIFRPDKLWRPALLLISIVLVFLGGFRSALIMTFATIGLQFFLEGLHRTKAMVFAVIFGLACAGVIIPFAHKLPFTFQRTLAFLPRSVITLNPMARMDAQASLDWRVDMWDALLPEIPKHLLLGKGYAISMEDYAVMGRNSAFREVDAAEQALALSSDYHNGPLSVILPFGIWGVIAFLWFTAASLWVMYRNYRYGDPELQTLNTFLFTIYAVHMFHFYIIFGDISSGMAIFTGLLGLSVAINRGVCRVPVKQVEPTIRFRAPDPARSLAPRPAFQSNGGSSPGSFRPRR